MNEWYAAQSVKDFPLARAEHAEQYYIAEHWDALFHFTASSRVLMNTIYNIASQLLRASRKSIWRTVPPSNSRNFDCHNFYLGPLLRHMYAYVQFLLIWMRFYMIFVAAMVRCRSSQENIGRRASSAGLAMTYYIWQRHSECWDTPTYTRFRYSQNIVRTKYIPPLE